MRTGTRELIKWNHDIPYIKNRKNDKRKAGMREKRWLEFDFIIFSSKILMYVD